MFDVPADLAADHALALAALPLPLPPAGVRALRAASADEHRYAQAHRKTCNRRCAADRRDRLKRVAARADARAADFAAEAR